MSKRIVVVGGGVGGTMLANQLAGKLYPEIQRGEVSITLLSGFAGSLLQTGLHVRGLQSLLPRRTEAAGTLLLRPEIEFRVDKVTRFHFDRQELSTQSGQRHGYDYLVIATGCVPSPERIEGLKETGDHFYQYAAARQLADRLSRIERGRVFVSVTFPRRPTFRTNAASPPSRPH